MRLFASLERPKEPSQYRSRLMTVGRLLAPAGFEGLLIVQNRKQMGGWAIAALVAELAHLSPLVAVSPAHAHPLTAVREAASIAVLYDLPVGLNLIMGTGSAERAAYGSPSPTDAARFVEFSAVIAELARSGTSSFSGEYYVLKDAYIGFLDPACDSTTVWAVVAGASAVAHSAATGGQLPRVTHLLPNEHLGVVDPVKHVGIVTRPTAEAAWTRARSLFPTQARANVSPEPQTAWQRELAGADAQVDPVYWKTPFEQGARPYPYLVGSYEQIHARLDELRQAGVEMLVVQRTAELEDLVHLRHVVS